MVEQLAAWRAHRDAQEQGRVPWNARFLDLPPLRRNRGGFVDVYPPLLQLGGAGVTDRPVVLISLEPLLDDENFDRQLCYLRGEDAILPFTPLFYDVSIERYEALQLRYWELFPELIAKYGTRYWANIHSFVSGLVGLPPPSQFSPRTLHEHLIELPLIPMHAPKHRTLRGAALTNVQNLFTRRLSALLNVWTPRLVVGLGGDVVKLLLAMGVGEAVDSLAGPVGHAYGSNFDVRYPTRLHQLVLPHATVPVFLRGAPFTTGCQPRGEGVHALGAMIRERASAPSAAS